MKRLFAVVLVLLASMSLSAQFDRNDLHFYDDEFDWHWDIRVRISDGERSGLLTNWEANRLYRRLERLEEREYRYMADGNYTIWEQDEIWDEVVWLNRRVGLELYDNDRRFYGFNRTFISFNMYPFWWNRWYGGGFDFCRFDALGFGNIYVGYRPYFWVPRNYVVFNNNRVFVNNVYYNTTYYNNTVRPYRETIDRRDRRTVNTSTSASRQSRGVVNSPRTSRNTGVYSGNRTSSRVESSRRESDSYASRSNSPNGTASRSGTVDRSSSRSSSIDRSSGSRSSSPSSSIDRPSSRTYSPSSRSSSSTIDRSSSRSSSPSRSSSVERSGGRTYSPSARSSSPSRSSSSSVNRSSNRTYSPSARSSSSNSRSSSINRSSSRSSSPSVRSSSSSTRSSSGSRSSSSKSSSSRSSSSRSPR